MIIEKTVRLGGLFLCIFIAMKYALAILFVLFGSITFGQKYNTCEIYRYYGNDSTHQSLVFTQTFNDAGKIVHEVCNDMDNYDGPGAEYIKYAGLYDYYYENGLLKMVKSAATPGKYDKHLDTTITSFYYYADKRLSKEVSTNRMYGCPATDTIIIVDDGEPNGPNVVYYDTLDTTVVHYYYNLEGKMTIKDHWHSNDGRANGTEFFKYDEMGRVIVDSAYAVRQTFIKRFLYDDNGYSYVGFLDGGYGGKEEYILDSNKRVVEHSYFYDSDDKSVVGSIVYKLLYRDLTEYFPNGRIARTRHYDDNNELTTTHIFVYK